MQQRHHLVTYWLFQRSLISYKSKMVMRSIPELLNESSSHVSIAVARHLKEGSPPPSSSSDSDADVDELPFIPMPLSMVFSGSRVSLNEIPGDEDVTARPCVAAEETRKRDDTQTSDKRGVAHQKRLKDEEETINEGKMDKTRQVPLKKGTESDDSETKARRATMRRGSSADSALLLHIGPEEENASNDSEGMSKNLKKAVSMELPNRSPSPGPAKLSQEDYALKLELMRQRLLRGGSVDKKMSGLRGPLFETLGIDDDKRTGSLDRNLRRSRTAQSNLTRAASSESPGEDRPQTKVFRKSASFTQGDSEPMPLHRRFGAPLEIPSAGNENTEAKKLQEATSVSALAEQTTLESTSAISPTKKTLFVLPSPGGLDQQHKWNVKSSEGLEREDDGDGITEKRTKTQLEKADEGESKSPSVITPIIVIEEDDEDEEDRKGNQELINEREIKEGTESVEESSKVSSAYVSQTSEKVRPTDDIAAVLPNGTKSTEKPASPEHAAVFSKVATAARSPGSNTDLPVTPRQPVLRTDIKDIDSEEVFEARFKKRESSLTRGLRKLTRNKSEEKSPVLNRKAGDRGEEIYRPGARGAPLEMVSKGLQEKSKSVQDLREDKEAGLGLIGRFSLRAKRSTSVDKKGEKQQEVQDSAASKRVSWAIGRSKSLDTKEPSSAAAQRQLDERKADESSVSAMRRRFESKVAGISAKIRTQSEERRDKDGEGSEKELAQKDLKKVTDSPVLAMRQRFENKVAGISSKIRSQSEERKEDTEGKRTPLFTRHRHSQSEGRGLKGMGIPENQLAKQTGTAASKESVDSTSSIHSEKAPESDRRSRWDRWGLTRSKKERTSSPSDLPSSAPKEEGLSKSQQFERTVSDFAPVFHIKLKDHVLLEGEPVTLSCLPAGSPHPEITWKKGTWIKSPKLIRHYCGFIWKLFFFYQLMFCFPDRKPLEVDDRISLISHPDGRQLLMIIRSNKRDDGVYECVATNPIATVTTSCTLSIACKWPE